MNIRLLAGLFLMAICFSSGTVYAGNVDCPTYYTCPDGVQVPYCETLASGDCSCIQSPESQCDSSSDEGDGGVPFTPSSGPSAPPLIIRNSIPPCASYGDLDDDGYVTYADRDLMLLHSVGDGDFTDDQESRADLDGNGQSGDAVDVALIVQFVAGDISTFPVCTSRGIPEDRTSGPSDPIVMPRSPKLMVAHENGGVQCSIDEPCKQGLECIEFPKVGRICAEPNPCSYYECPSGTSCMVAESYPAQVMCQCTGPDCSDDSGSTNTAEYNVQTRTVVVGVNGINVRSREVTISRTIPQNEGSGIVSKPKGVLKSGAFSAEYFGELILEGSGLYMTTSAGKRRVNILPEDVVGIPEMPAMESVEIELREDSGRPAYFVKGTKQAKLFFVIPISMEIETNVDAETGEIISMNKPWWSFIVW